MQGGWVPPTVGVGTNPVGWDYNNVAPYVASEASYGANWLNRIMNEWQRTPTASDYIGPEAYGQMYQGNF